MEKFKEKKIVENLMLWSILITILWLINILLIAVNDKFAIGFLLIAPAFILMTIAEALSNKDRYTSKFIYYMNNKLAKVKSLEDLYQIEKEFKELAIEGKTYCLNYPVDLKIIHQEIINKISILETIKNNEPKS